MVCVFGVLGFGVLFLCLLDLFFLGWCGVLGDVWRAVFHWSTATTLNQISEALLWFFWFFGGVSPYFAIHLLPKTLLDAMDECEGLVFPWLPFVLVGGYASRCVILVRCQDVSSSFKLLGHANLYHITLVGSPCCYRVLSFCFYC